MNFRHGPKAVFSYYLICLFPSSPSGGERGKVFYNSESNDGEQFVYVIFLVMPVFKFLFWSFLEPSEDMLDLKISLCNLGNGRAKKTHKHDFEMKKKLVAATFSSFG